MAGHPVIVPGRELEEEKSQRPARHASGAGFAPGRRARNIGGFAPADTNGTRLIEEVSAHRAF